MLMAGRPQAVKKAAGNQDFGPDRLRETFRRDGALLGGLEGT
jgi:hypothetical protein